MSERDVHICLPSGMSASLLSRAGAPEFAASLKFRGGFLTDPESMSGLSHLCEHLLVTCNSSRVEALSRRGIHINAQTGLEFTTVWVSGAAARCKEALALFADILSGAVRPADAEIARELSVLESEESGAGFSKFDVNTATTHGIIAGLDAQRLLGLHDFKSLRRTPPDRIRDHMSAAFRPSQAHLTVASPDAQRDAEDLISGGGWPMPELTDADRPAEADPPPVRPLYVLRFPSPQVAVSRMFHFRPWAVLPGPALTIISELLSSGPHSAMFRAFRATSPEAYYFGQGGLLSSKCVIVELTAVVRPADGYAALRRLHDVVEYARTGLRHEETGEAVARLIEQHTVDDSLPSVVCALATSSMDFTGFAPATPSRCIASLRATTYERVRDTAQRLFRPERSTTVVGGGVGLIGLWKYKRLVKSLSRGS